MFDRTNKTLICSVVFLDIVEYSKKPVSAQMRLKEAFNRVLAEALGNIAPNDRIAVDTGDGAAIGFLGDPEDALFVALSLRDNINELEGSDAYFGVRIGINLGPVKLVKDINGRPNLIGDGINAAQRVMSFAEPGCVLVSRSYYEVVSRLSEEYGQLFQYDGAHTDKHVREHEVYHVGLGTQLTHRPQHGRKHAMPSGDRQRAMMPSRKWLGYGVAAGVGLLLLSGGGWWLMRPSSAPDPQPSQLTAPDARTTVQASPPSAIPTQAPIALVPKQIEAAPPAVTAQPLPLAGDVVATQAVQPTLSSTPPLGGAPKDANGKLASKGSSEKPPKSTTKKAAPPQVVAEVPTAAAVTAEEKRPAKHCPVAECWPDGRPKRDR